MFPLWCTVGSCYLRSLKYLSIFPVERACIMENKWSFNGHWLHQTIVQMLFSHRNHFVCISYKRAIKIEMETAFCVLVVTSLTMLMLSLPSHLLNTCFFFFHLPYVDPMRLKFNRRLNWMLCSYLINEPHRSEQLWALGIRFDTASLYLSFIP